MSAFVQANRNKNGPDENLQRAGCGRSWLLLCNERCGERQDRRTITRRKLRPKCRKVSEIGISVGLPLDCFVDARMGFATFHDASRIVAFASAWGASVA